MSAPAVVPFPGSPLAEALGRLVGPDAPGTLVASAVSRVEVEMGELFPTFVFTLDAAAGERWIRVAGSQVVELSPDLDPALPLAARRAGDPVLAYRPGRRIVLLRVRSQAVEKGYRRTRLEAAATRHELVNRLAGTVPGLVLPRLRDRCDATASLLLERLDGVPLHLGPGTVDQLESFGRALRGFQETPLAGVSLPEHHVAQELSVLDQRAERVAVALGGVSERWRQGRELAARCASELPAASVGLTHRDLHDGQIQIVGKDLALVDFDLLCRADPALDAGNLLAHFELRRLQRFAGVSRRVVTAASRAFLAGFGRCGEAGFAERLSFYRAASLLRLALVYEIRPRWEHLAPALIEEAFRCFDMAHRSA